jgi:rsbT co-antagonist protein RsbR
VKTISTIVKNHQAELPAAWAKEMTVGTRREDLIRDKEFEGQLTRFVSLLQQATQSGAGDPSRPEFEELREFLSDMSRTRAQQGFSPTEIAMFVLSFKKPLFNVVRADLAKDPAALAEQTWRISELLDKLALYTTEIHQKTREEIIDRQQQEMMELSTPVVKLWEGVVALPLIGTLDSARTQVVMESLLQRIVETGSEMAIIDITGVPTVDTLVAQHLLKTVTAARLMGAECIISGIRPQIAQTIVHLGVELGGVITKSSLADAFALALRRKGMSVVRDQQRPQGQ